MEREREGVGTMRIANSNLIPSFGKVCVVEGNIIRKSVGCEWSDTIKKEKSGERSSFY